MSKVLVSMICAFMIFGCAAKEEVTYRDYMMNRDLSPERGRQLTPEEKKYECSLIRREVEKLKLDLLYADSAKSEKELSEMRWFEKRASFLDCQFESSFFALPVPGVVEQPSKVPEKATSPESAAGSGDVIKDDSKTEETSPRPASGIKPVPVSPMTFDQCFMKCKELTKRTNEECFDACLGR
jgi:hypothetical protein